jgi:hypothetical protein
MVRWVIAAVCLGVLLLLLAAARAVGAGILIQAAIFAVFIAVLVRLLLDIGLHSAAEARWRKVKLWTMREWGICLLVVGGVGLLLTLFMGTSVEIASEFGFNRVHNLGLMEERQTYLALSAVVTIVGALLLGFGILASRGDRKPSGPRCPMCNGVLDGQPKLCWRCRTPLQWSDGIPTERP